MTLAARYFEIKSRIEATARLTRRDPADITLIVVTKKHSTQLVLDLLKLGVSDFGENRDQEAASKAAEVRSISSTEHRWHFIGQLQSNKVKSVLNYADSVHSLDRHSLLDSLAKATREYEKSLDVFIQLNLTEEPGRGGIQSRELARFAEQVLEQSSLNLVGVMGVASLDNQLERDFTRIAEASEVVKKIHPAAKFISAGMSEDFETAIAFGATHLRIGSAITGNRQH